MLKAEVRPSEALSFMKRLPKTPFFWVWASLQHQAESARAMPQYLPNGIQIAPYQPNAPGAALTVCGGFGGFGSIGAARADLCISGSISYTIPNRLPHKKPLNITRSPREKNDRSPTLISPYFHNSWLKESSALRQELEDRLAPSQAFA